MRAASHGLKTTLELLSETENEASVRVLVAALDSPHGRVRDGALGALLARRSLAGHRELVRRLHTFDQRWMDRMREHAVRMRQALRDAVLETDPQVCENGCRAAVWLGEYDLVPTLANALADAANPNANLVAATLLDLVAQLRHELDEPEVDGRRRDPRLVRPHVLTALESAVERFPRHPRREVIEAYLLLASWDSALLKQILQNPHHTAFPPVIDLLSKSTAVAIVRLLLSYLDDPHAPSSVINVLASRSDVKFLRHFLRKVARDNSAAIEQNLKRIRTLSWLQAGATVFDRLDDQAQRGVVRLVMASSMPRLQAFNTIEYVLLHGKREGRRAAAEALQEFNGAAANALALKALEDEDPQVQAGIVAQLRSRGIPGILPRIVEMLESRHAAVRNAARKSLAEFSFKRFLGAFDMLDEEVRRSTGLLVRKIDPDTIPRLRLELSSKSRTRVLRGISVARTIDAVAQVEPQLVDLVGSEDHIVRAEAAAALAQANSESSRKALRRAESDRSAAVQQAAARSLKQRDQFAYYREALADPRD